MKFKYLMYCILGSLIIYSCEKEDNRSEVVSESDHEVLEGMEEAFHEASLYNDSLANCINDFINCDSTRMWHYDDMFHHYDSLFNQHHNNYSHNNLDDDHHHSNNQTVWHGSMIGHGDGHDDPHNEEPHGYEHNNESIEEMMHLREEHHEFHPN